MNVLSITSLTNPRIKKIVQLRKSKVRRQEGTIIVEGKREIEQALNAQIDFQEIYVSNTYKQKLNAKVLNLIQSHVPVYETSSLVFSKIAYGQKEEGILAVCKKPNCDFSDFKKAKNSLFVIVERIEKPGNLGAILRTCDGVGVTGVIVCEENTDIYNPNVIRASLGAVFSVKVKQASNEKALDFLKSNAINLCAALPAAKKIYTEVNLNQSIAIIMGSEEKGLSDFWKQKANLKVRIPMNGKVDSLNVSASTAILLYEALRQRISSYE